MLRKIGRLFVIKTRFEAYAIIYALAMGAAQRGEVYLSQYPGASGKLLFVACLGSVVLAGVKISRLPALRKGGQSFRLTEAFA